MIVDLLNSKESEEEFKETFLLGLKNIHGEIITNGQEEGIFREGDPRLYEIFLQNMINPHIVKRISKIIPLEEATSFLGDLVLNGLLKKS